MTPLSHKNKIRQLQPLLHTASAQHTDTLDRIEDFTTYLGEVGNAPLYAVKVAAVERAIEDLLDFQLAMRMKHEVEEDKNIDQTAALLVKQALK